MQGLPYAISANIRRYSTYISSSTAEFDSIVRLIQTVVVPHQFVDLSIDWGVHDHRRVQCQIDNLLDEVEAALAQRDWAAVHDSRAPYYV